MTKKRANAEEILGTEMPEIVAQASEKQLKFYKDLTVQKNVELKSINSKEDVDKEIKYLLTLPTWKPVIEDGGQMRAIKNLTKALNLPEPDFTKLNGAYNGSASQLITKLQEMASKIVMPISEKQLAIIEDMNYCIDVPKVESPESLSLKEASEHIGEYQSVYYNWKNKIRPTDKQIETVQTLTKDSGHELELDAIMAFDRVNISDYISQLFAEQKDASLKETTLEPEQLAKPDEDAITEMRTLCTNLYASIGQDVEEETYNNINWVSLRELIDFVKLFGIDTKNFFDKLVTFTPDQIAYLTE